MVPWRASSTARVSVSQLLGRPSSASCRVSGVSITGGCCSAPAGASAAGLPFPVSAPPSVWPAASCGALSAPFPSSGCAGSEPSGTAR